jgi:hypothetical protein
MEVTLFGSVRSDGLSESVALSFESHGAEMATVDSDCAAQTGPTLAKRAYLVWVPVGSTLLRNDDASPMLLYWNLPDGHVRSTANEVYDLAKARVHGFRFVGKPVA